MTAQLITEAGNPIPPEVMLDWCQIWGDGDRRLRCDEITLHVLGRDIFRVQGQLWLRLRDRELAAFGEEP